MTEQRAFDAVTRGNAGFVGDQFPHFERVFRDRVVQVADGVRHGDGLQHRDRVEGEHGDRYDDRDPVGQIGDRRVCIAGELKEGEKNG